MLIAGCCLAGIACHRVRSSPATVKIPLLTCSGLPCVDATFGQTNLRLLVDLADQTSYLTAAGLVKAEAARPPKEFGKARKFKLGLVELNDLFAVDETLNGAVPNGAERLAPGIDGSLSYNAFSDRLLVLNMPGRFMEVSPVPLSQPVCPANCSELHDSRVGDVTGDVTLTADGFSVGNSPLRARLDTLFHGSVAILEPVKGLRTEDSRPIEGSYGGNKLSLLEIAPVYFRGKVVANDAPVVRADPAFGIAGRQYNSAVGLSILSAGAYAFDLRSMKMWRYE